MSLYFKHDGSSPLVACSDVVAVRRVDGGYNFDVTLHNSGPEAVSASLTLWYADPVVTFFNGAIASPLITDAGVGYGNGTQVTNPQQVPPNDGFTDGSADFSFGWTPPVALDGRAAILAQAPGSTSWAAGSPLNAQYDLSYAAVAYEEYVYFAFGLVNPEMEKCDTHVSVRALGPEVIDRALHATPKIRRLLERGYRPAIPTEVVVALGKERIVPPPVGNKPASTRLHHQGMITSNRYERLLDSREGREIGVALEGSEIRQCFVRCGPKLKAREFYVIDVGHEIRGEKTTTGGVLLVFEG